MGMHELVPSFRRDILESEIYRYSPELLNILLVDRSMSLHCGNVVNITWSTGDYAFRDEINEGGQTHFQQNDQIVAECICHDMVIVPRVCKCAVEQKRRIQEKGEVFTPAWVCNAQNNLVDNSWFGRKNVFNSEDKKCWVPTSGKIKFPRGKTWQEYVCEVRLEITCGEAPYLASRYDMSAPVEIVEVIPVERRIGILDRKLRIVTENCSGKREWINWATKALQSCLGFDWQGDNVFLARENLLYTMMEAYFTVFNGATFTEEQLKRFAEIVSWNIWQMDGLKFVVPNTCFSRLSELKDDKLVQGDLFSDFEDKSKKQMSIEQPCPGCAKRNQLDGAFLHNGIYAYVMNWETKKSVRFVDHLRRKTR